MQNMTTTTSHEMSQKDLWINAFIAALHQTTPGEALKIADEALKLCNNRWINDQPIQTCTYRHSYPVGHRFLGDKG